MGDVIQLPGTERDISVVQGTEDPSVIPIDHVLDGEYARELTIGLLLGRTEDDEFFFASTHADIGKLLVLLERAKRSLVDHID